MKIILAIDSFKGALSSKEAEKAARKGVLGYDKNAEVVSFPMTDGGDGMLNVFADALKGHEISVRTHDPLMRLISAEYAITSNHTAIIEVAKACGLELIEPKERDIRKATTYGVGEIINDAIDKECRDFIIGLGGTGTSDCGIGMLSALKPSAKNKVDTLNFLLATDVENPLFGKKGAAYVYGKQKGADEEDIIWLDNRAEKFAEQSKLLLSKDCSSMPGAGAAGGLGYAFMQYLNAQVIPGAELLLKEIDFDGKIKDASLIITGEGSADKQTLMGKLPATVLSHAKRQNIPVFLVAGKIEDEKILKEAGFEAMIPTNNPALSLEENMQPERVKSNIRKAVTTLLTDKLGIPAAD